MADRYIIVEGRRGWLNLVTLTMIIVAILAIAAYALIPISVTTALMMLLFWLLLPRLPGMPRIGLMQALGMSLLIIAAYAIPTIIMRILFHTVAVPLSFPSAFGLNPLTQRLLWIRGQFLLTWPSEILLLLKYIREDGVLVDLLGEIPGILLAGLALKWSLKEGFKGALGYGLACVMAATALLLVSWIGMTLEVMIVPKVVGETFHLLVSWM